MKAPGSGPVRLAMWSGPRNISTALMRAWENRPDTVVVDEPLYSHYLDQTGLDHPGREQVIVAGEADWRRVVAELTNGDAGGAGVYYQKHMAHHLLPQMTLDWVGKLHNVLLIRDPGEVVASYVKSRAHVTLADIGLPQQLLLLDELTDAAQVPPIIDSADFLRQPELYLRWLCDWIGVDFTDRMLSWPPGPRKSDGVWAPHWYEAVERSTGFRAYQPHEVSLTAGGADVAEQADALYHRLFLQRLVL